MSETRNLMNAGKTVQALALRSATPSNPDRPRFKSVPGTAPAEPGTSGLWPHELRGRLIRLEHVDVVPFAESGADWHTCTVVASRHDSYPVGGYNLSIPNRELIDGVALETPEYRTQSEAPPLGDRPVWTLPTAELEAMLAEHRTDSAEQTAAVEAELTKRAEERRPVYVGYDRTSTGSSHFLQFEGAAGLLIDHLRNDHGVTEGLPEQAPSDAGGWSALDNRHQKAHREAAQPVESLSIAALRDEIASLETAPQADQIKMRLIDLRDELIRRTVTDEE
jgi:hypothetical protein